jgi:hypothetical protein
MTFLPPRIPKKPKRATRWRSQAHCNFVRGYSCSNCTSPVAIEVAHVRIGSGAGVGQKPDDWRAVSLCRECHQAQHRIGETTFWKMALVDPEQLIASFIAASPKRREIEETMRERGL